MLVEHTLVTTLEMDEAFTVARGFLEELGFELRPGAAEPCSLQMRRGRFKDGDAGRVSESPQFVRLDFDRGRVAVAVSVHERRKSNRSYAALLIALARGMERLLTEFAPISEARAEWDEADRQVEASAAGRRTRSNLVIGCFVALVGAGVVLAVLAFLLGRN